MNIYETAFARGHDTKEKPARRPDITWHRRHGYHDTARVTFEAAQ